MKLERITEEANPGYPSFNEHRMRRRSAIKVMCGGLIALFAAGCNFLGVRTAGVMKAPDQPVGATTNELPLESPAPVKGILMAPEPPAGPEPVSFRGDMVAPRAPERTKGRMAPVRPIPKE